MRKRIVLLSFIFALVFSIQAFGGGLKFLKSKDNDFGGTHSPAVTKTQACASLPKAKQHTPPSPCISNDYIVSWGVAPNTVERIPDPPDGSRTMLSRNNGIFVADTQDKKVYLTFDLGYEAGYTGEVLDILRDNGISAVFFLCGNYLKETHLVNRMIAEGHAIGNHTDKHKDLPTLNEQQIKTDIVDLQNNFIASYPDTPMVYFRPPKGRFNEKTLKIAAEEGLKTMMWSIAIVDWGKEPMPVTPNAEKIASRVHPGAIILLHITNSSTPEMLRQLLPKITQKGYTVGGHSDLR